MSSFFSSYLKQRGTLVPGALTAIGLSASAICLATAIFLLFDFSRLYKAKTAIVRTFSTIWILGSSLLSIDAGVIAFLNFWGCDLDILSVIGILISTGLAIDFITHVAHKLEHCPSKYTAEQKVLETLESIGWPVLQAGISTGAGVLVLSAVPSYLIRVLYKSILLVVLFGLYHGLFVLPLIYMIISGKAAPHRK